MPKIIIRPAVEADAAGMLALYAPYVEQTTVSSEYEAPSLEEFLHRLRTYTEKCRGCSVRLTVSLRDMATHRRTVPVRAINGQQRPQFMFHRRSIGAALRGRFILRCLNC